MTGEYEITFVLVLHNVQFHEVGGDRVMGGYQRKILKFLKFLIGNSYLTY